MKDKIKKIVKPIFILLGIIYVAIFIISLTGYYESLENKNSRLTTEAIERFEKDILKGEEIVASNYLEEKEDYDNLFTRLGLNIGNAIEFIFKKVMKGILTEIEKAVK
ncbi:MAG: hypothetical protein IKH54_03885 [Bacilli bacterium]|nr:hypothetical protein [Bacilli bacterium]